MSDTTTYTHQSRESWVYELPGFVREHRLFSVALIGVIIVTLCAITAPAIAPYDPAQISLKTKNALPSAEHLLGTDYLGRDTLSRILYGAQTSLSIAFVTVILSAVIGVMAGMAAGYYGGKVDDIISRVIDVFLPFPGMIIALAILAFFPPGMYAIICALTLHSWAGFARIVRNDTYSMKTREFVLSARLSGLSDFKIMKNHILPNIAAPILILMTLDVGSVILSIAGLSYLGLGIPTDIPEWGAMISNGKEFIRSAPLLTIIPGIVITAVVLLFNIMGEELRSILNPVSEGVQDL